MSGSPLLTGKAGADYFCTALIVLALFGVCASLALAASYDVTVDFSPPSAGPVPDSYNLYLNDCAATGATAAPAATVTQGQKFVGLFPVDGSYTICVRPVNATGENPDPETVIPIDTLEAGLPGAIENLTITIEFPCGTGTCSRTYQ